MSYLYKFCVFLLILASVYVALGIGHFKLMYARVDNPRAEFLVSGDVTSDETIVEFLNYGCGYCKEIYPRIEELKQVRKDVRFVVRPIILGDEGKDKITRLAIAAGLQDKFDEMHKAFLEYPELEIPNDFIEETANLYGVDYAQMVEDANGKEVTKILENNFKALESAGITSVPALMVKDQIYIIPDEGLPNLKQLLQIISPQRSN